MSEKTKNNKKNTGFYIALCCCVGIIGIVGYFTNREEQKIAKVNPSQSPAVINPTPKTTKTPEEKPLPTLSPTVEPKEIKEEAVAVSSIEEVEIDIDDENTDILEKGEPLEFYDGETVESVSINQDPSFILPVDGEIKEKFSGENLVYNKAMDDWRTHNGIDIIASKDSEILVSSDGIIDEIYTDYLGNTVVIDHKNGFKTKYSNLDTVENLTIGVKMKQGDFLAKIGNYALGENISEPHLHFEIIKNEKFVNPEEYIG